MEIIKKIATSYGINPQKINKITDAVHQIDDGQQLYAVKRSALTNRTITIWENVYHLAQQHYLNIILPVYLTRQSSLYQEIDGVFYYLTPWENSKQPTIEEFYRSIGKIHAKTTRSQTIELTDLIDPFNEYKRYCKAAKEKLLTYVMRFERNRYMAPFELQVCTHYRDIELILKRLIERIDLLIDEEKEQSIWKHSLCHGNLSFSHIFAVNQTYIINWERAHYANATADLVVFFKNQITSYDTDIKSFIDSFTCYMDENKLNNSELYLLVIHLLDPAAYMMMIQQYIDGKSTETMINQVKRLEYTYRQLIFGLELSNHLEKEFTTIDFDD